MARPLTILHDLVIFRPSTPVQQRVQQRGTNWKVHRLEDASSYLSMDYYSVLITRRPNKPDGLRMTGEEVFT